MSDHPEVQVTTQVATVQISRSLLEDFAGFDPFRPLTPEEERRERAFMRRKARENAKRTDCDAEHYVGNYDSDETVECELPAGHPGPHRYVMEWDRRPDDHRAYGFPAPEPQQEGNQP